MSDDAESDGPYVLKGSLGDLEVVVKGDDSEWVQETFEETWSRRLEESSEMKEAMRKADRLTQ